ncbi:MAG TPA: class I SAM-dependent methyltransferase [Nitrososphaerales archaeon]|nr:class I SAM-dependent methyltransferase [Nitrososphaerales archaeon]
MDRELSELLDTLYEFGTDYDSKVKNHVERMLNITHDTGLFLSILIQAVRANRALELGTSNGSSTLWIADALRNTSGKVTTVKVSEKKVSMATGNFEKSGLKSYVNSRLEDVRLFLKSQEDESFDLVFLDAERPEYTSYWRDLDRVLKQGGLLIVDNALAPRPERIG